MAIPGIPDIPNFKGLVTSGTDALISFGGASLIRMVFGNQWGIFNQFGIPIMLADTVHSVKYANSSQIAQAPVEKGEFASYNKVQNPYQASVTMIRGGGDPALRSVFMAQLETLSKSTLLFNVITPEYVHRNAAIVGFDYARSPQDGARMIVANIHLEEVREAKVTYATKVTENPEDAAQVDTGEQQPAEASASVLSRVVDTISADGGLSQTLQTLGEKATEMFNKFVGGTPGVVTP